MNKAKAKALLSDFLYGSEGAQMWAEDVWGLSAFLGQGAANTSEVIALLLEICSERQLLMLMQAIYQKHEAQIQALDSASAWAELLNSEPS